jgi:hypothetical protein
MTKVRRAIDRVPIYTIILLLAAASFFYTQIDMMRRISSLEETLNRRPDRALYIINGQVERSDSDQYPAMVIEGKMRIYLTGEYRKLIGEESSFLIAMTEDGKYEILGYRRNDAGSKYGRNNGTPERI